MFFFFQPQIPPFLTFSRTFFSFSACPWSLPSFFFAYVEALHVCKKEGWKKNAERERTSETCVTTERTEVHGFSACATCVLMSWTQERVREMLMSNGLKGVSERK